MPLIALWLALVVAWAGATDETVIELEHQPGEEPDYVCVITATGANDLVALEALGGFEAADPEDLAAAQWFALAEQEAWDLSGASAAALQSWVPEAIASIGRSGPEAAAGEACEATPSDPGRSCREPDPACCSPELRLKRDPAVRAERYRVACAENVRAHRNPRHFRTLLMSVDFESPRGFSPIIRGVRLDGSVVHLKYRGDVRSWPFPVVSVVGGDYVVGRSRVMSERQASLDLHPRCRTHDVQLPPMVLNTADGSVGVHAHLESPADHPVSSCRAEVRAGSRFEVVLPFLDTPGEKVLRVVADGRTPEEPTAELRASWYEARPPKVAEARAHRASFGWRVHCMYAGAGSGRSCPTATLEAHGIPCTGSDAPDDEGICRYQCGQSGREVEFALPTAVQLEGPYEDRWTRQLSYVGEVLDGYVPIEDRRLTVDFSAWAATPEELERQVGVAGDRIRFVDVASPNGSVHRVVPTGEGRQRLFVPGATCGDLLSYRIHGDRLFYEEAVAVEAGQLKLKHPRVDGQVVSINFGILGGLTGGFGARGFAGPSGSLSAAVSIRPFGSIRDQPARRTVWFEFPHVSSSISREPYDGLPVDTLGRNRNTVEVPYHRLTTAGLVLTRPIDERLTVGFGPGVFVGYSVYTKHLTEMGGVRVRPSGVLDLRWRMGRDVAVAATLRGFQSQVTQFLWNPAGQPTIKTTTIPAMDAQGGLRFGR